MHNASLKCWHLFFQRENAKITVKVTQQQEKQEEATAARQQPAAGWEVAGRGIV